MIGSGTWASLLLLQSVEQKFSSLHLLTCPVATPVFCRRSTFATILALEKAVLDALRQRVAQIFTRLYRFLLLKEILLSIAKEIMVEILEMEIMPDYVHLLVEIDPQFGVHRAVKRFKGASSRYLRSCFPHLKSRLPTLWTNSYFVATVGGAPLDVINPVMSLSKNKNRSS